MVVAAAERVRLTTSQKEWSLTVSPLNIHHTIYPPSFEGSNVALVRYWFPHWSRAVISMNTRVGERRHEFDLIANEIRKNSQCRQYLTLLALLRVEYEFSVDSRKKFWTMPLRDFVHDWFVQEYKESEAA